MISTSSSYIASQVSTLRRERLIENPDSKVIENDSGWILNPFFNSKYSKKH